MNGNVDPFAIWSYINLRSIDPHLHITLVEINIVQQLYVPIKSILLIGATAGDETEEATLLGLHDTFEFSVEQITVAKKSDTFDLHFVIFLNFKGQLYTFTFGDRVDARSDSGKKITFIFIKLLQLLGRLPHLIH